MSQQQFSWVLFVVELPASFQTYDGAWFVSDVCHKPRLRYATEWTAEWSPHHMSCYCVLRNSDTRQIVAADSRHVHQCSRLAWWAIQSPSPTHRTMHRSWCWPIHWSATMVCLAMRRMNTIYHSKHLVSLVAEAMERSPMDCDPSMPYQPDWSSGTIRAF